MATTITVNGTYQNQDGTPASGRVSFRLSTALTDAENNVIVAPVLKTVELSGGAFSTTLAATNDPDIEQSGATYTVTEVIDGATHNGNRYRSYAVEIPYDATDGTVDLADLAPVEDATVTYGVTSATFAAHLADTTDIHGIADTSLLSTGLTTHLADTTDVHGITDTSALETTTGSAAKVTAHTAITTSIHGIDDTSLLETATGAQSKVDTLAALTPSLEDFTVQQFYAGGMGNTVVTTVPLFVAPFPCEIVYCAVVPWGNAGNIAASDTSYWTVDIKRRRVSTITTIATKTTQATGGEALLLRREWHFDTVPFDEDLKVLQKGDVVYLAFTPTSTPTAIVDALLALRYQPV